MRIPVEDIGAVIGPQGKVIKDIQERTGATIAIEDDGSVIISSPGGIGGPEAKAMIERIVEKPEIGRVYSGPVKGIKEFGCFVECTPGKEGLVHISELADFRVRRTEDVVKMGEMITVKCIGVDERTGKVRLSRKAAMQELESRKAAPAEPSSEAAS